MEFTLETAQRAASENKLYEWVIAYLHDHGNNKRLAQDIELRIGATCNLQEINLTDLNRITGPEHEGRIFTEDAETWEQRVQNLTNDIEQGFLPPPLIATNFWEKGGNLADGNHRHEALIRLGYVKYWTIIFTL